MTAGRAVVYLIHFDQRYKHAGHYTGWTTDLAARLAAHAAGQGARLMAVISQAGITWRLARTWPGSRVRERQIKRRGGASRLCPLCGVRPRTPAAQPLPGPRRPASPPQPPPSAQVRPSAAERGAAAARIVISQQVRAGQSPAKIAAVQAAMFRDYDPLTARPGAREWHQAYQQAAADLIQSHREDWAARAAACEEAAA